MRNLILVRHSLPEIAPSVSPSNWILSREGRKRARLLALELRRNDADVVFSSTEPKAVETGAIIARELEIHLEVVADLHEHAGRGVGGWVSESEFRSRISSFSVTPPGSYLGPNLPTTLTAASRGQSTSWLRKVRVNRLPWLATALLCHFLPPERTSLTPTRRGTA